MTELQQYLAEEVAEDHVDGIITRREAIRRLGLLGVGATAASTMLAAEAAAHKAGKKSGGGHGHGHGGDGKETSWAPLATQDDHVRRPATARCWRPGRQAVEAARRRARHPREPRAQRSHPQRRGALRGVGLVGARARPALGGGRHGLVPGRGRGGRRAVGHLGFRPARFDADMKAALTRDLDKRVGRKPLAAIGFCFGGGMIWRLLAAREPRLAAAAPFYGPFPTGGEPEGHQGRRARRLRRARLAHQRVDAAAKAALEAARARLRAADVHARPTTRSSTTRARRASTRRPPRRRGGG